jgi:hypothetical protein
MTKGLHRESIVITNFGCFSNAASTRNVANDQEAMSTENAGMSEDNEKLTYLPFGSQAIA